MYVCYKIHGENLCKESRRQVSYEADQGMDLALLVMCESSRGGMQPLDAQSRGTAPPYLTAGLQLNLHMP